MADYTLIKVTELPAATSLDDLVIAGVLVTGDKSVKVPVDLIKQLVAAATQKAEQALSTLPLKVEMTPIDETEYPDLTI